MVFGVSAHHTSRQSGWIVAALGLALVGCGATKSRTATEQLLMSDAVDRAVAQIDFRDLAGQKVFFETRYLVNTKDPQFLGNQKGLGFVNAEYVTSSLRQQMVAADLRLQDKIEEADFVVEARLGAVGVDNNEIIYGLPASAPLSTAASTMMGGPPLPTIPEISFARKNVQVGAAKVGVFAYDRRTRQPVWQAGISQAMSDARDSWVLGVGPFQRGTIYKGTQFAGTRLDVPGLSKLPPLDVEEEPASPEQQAGVSDDPYSFYSHDHLFAQPQVLRDSETAGGGATPATGAPRTTTASGVRQASAESPVAVGEPRTLAQPAATPLAAPPPATAPSGAAPPAAAPPAAAPASAPPASSSSPPAAPAAKPS
ncbi:MAG: DUF6655 family protein [Pirellulales bacterium]